ncbi:hypothetical protein K504DRAFT_508587 [Pleomassaria siparia CBS 279.74]|uniref:Uncharacterized protein n=1 Tax=Pleomassaria siparia CBS 279.74 TaxID=1314801 RepID=A0A6G1JS16_9PLEO|nr:hypothetical protein K504DRAFT_508587 [Pleomassaria siparia CBS 279.74]
MNDGILLGLNADGNEVWAYMISCAADWRDVPGTHAVLLTAPSNLDVVAHWDTGIQGNTLVGRYAFVYDALVEEAKGNTG